VTASLQPDQRRVSHRDRHRIYTNKPSLNEALLTAEQLAERWQIKVASLANQRSRGVGPRFVRLPSGRVLYPWSAVADYELGLDTPNAA
jgi:hypothetical protein